MPQKSVKNQMLQVASEHFYRHGYDATSVKNVVEECQTTAPALYHHFGSKEGLALAYLESAADVQQQRWRPVFSKPSLPEIIDAWVKVIKSDIRKKEYFGCPIGNFSSQLDLAASQSPTHERLQQKIGTIFESWITAMSGRFQELQQLKELSLEVETTNLAIQLLNTYEGGLLVWRATHRKDVITTLCSQLVMISETALNPQSP